MWAYLRDDCSDNPDGDDNMKLDLGVNCSKTRFENTILSIFAPFWMINKTGKNLTYRGSDNNNVLEHPTTLGYSEVPMMFSYITTRYWPIFLLVYCCIYRMNVSTFLYLPNHQLLGVFSVEGASVRQSLRSKIASGQNRFRLTTLKIRGNFLARGHLYQRTVAKRKTRFRYIKSSFFGKD